MKAQIKPRINTEGRTALEKVIPLSTPMILFVDPSSACNFQCTFCPTGDRQMIKENGRYQGRLDIGLFRKIIDDLDDFDEPLKVLRMYKDGEPLMHKQLAEMVRYAKASGRVNYIDTTTNGLLISRQRVEPLIEAGLDRINISINGLNARQFKDFARVDVDVDDFVANIRELYQYKGDCEICVKITGDHLSDAEKQQFFDTYGDHADRIFIENTAPCWPEFEVEDRMNVEITRGIYGQPIGDTETCPYIFYQMSVNADGQVSLCFLDWARTLLIGDVRKQSLKAIWEGDALFEHRMAHLRGKRRENATCAGCGQLSHCMPDNIDPYVDELAERLLATRLEAVDA